MLYLYKLFLATLIFILAGCSGFPQKPEYSFSDDSKIGVIIDIDNQLEITQFRECLICKISSFQKTIDWELGKYAAELLKIELAEKEGYNLIFISPAQSEIETLRNPYMLDGTLSYSFSDVIDRFKEKHDLDALLFLREAKILHGISCNQFTCTYFYGHGIGLAKNDGFIFDTYSVAPGFHTDLYLVDSKFNLATTQDYMEINRNSRNNMVPLEEFKAPKNYQDPKLSELEDVKVILEKSLQQLVVKQRMMVLNEDFPKKARK